MGSLDGDEPAGLPVNIAGEEVLADDGIEGLLDLVFRDAKFVDDVPEHDLATSADALEDFLFEAELVELAVFARATGMDDGCNDECDARRNDGEHYQAKYGGGWVQRVTVEAGIEERAECDDPERTGDDDDARDEL